MIDRVRKILTLIIKNPEIKTTDLASVLGLSRRQINYALSQLNDELKAQELPAINRSHTGKFSVPPEVFDWFVHFTKEEDFDSQEILSENERTTLILLMLITNTEYVSLNHLIDFLDVSKSTVTEDLKKAEEVAGKYAIEIIYNRVNGYQLSGSEHRILQMMSDLVKKHKISQLESVKKTLSPKITEEETVHLIHEVEQQLKVSYSDESIDYLQTSLRYLITRGISSKEEGKVFFEGQVRETPEYKTLRRLIKESKWPLSISYIEWVTLLFLASNIFEKKVTEDYISDQPLVNFIHQMVDSFQKQTFILVDDRKLFEKRILTHLRPACFRIKYNLSLGVYSLDSLVQDSNHAILIELMRELIQPIEHWLGKSFPRDELELLSYYFGFQLSNHDGITNKKERAVVICTNGVIVSKLMQENLSQLFPELHFLAAFSVRDFYRFSVDYDVVFTTVPLKTKLPQFIIDPVMSYKEQVSLRYRVLKELGLKEVDHAIDNLVKIIQENASITNLPKLKESLQYFFMMERDESPFENFRVLPPLSSYIKDTFVQVCDQQLTWQEALSLACQPLLENQIVDETFVADCSCQISEAGYAGYLGTKMCIPHTTVEHGVLKDGVAFLVCKEPVVFPEGHRIQIIAPLAFYDLTQHLRAVNQLAEISSDEAMIAQIMKAANEQDVFQLLKEFES